MVNLQCFSSYDREYMEGCNVWKFYNIETEQFEVVTDKLIDFRVHRGNNKNGAIVTLIFKDKTYQARRDLSFTQIQGYNDIAEFIFYNTNSEHAYSQANSLGKTTKAFQDLLNECTDYQGEIKPWGDYRPGQDVYIIRYSYDSDCPYVCRSNIREVYRNEISTFDFYYNFNMITDDDYKIGGSREECLYVNRRLLTRQLDRYKLEAEIANKYLKENIKFINKFHELR